MSSNADECGRVGPSSRERVNWLPFPSKRRRSGLRELMDDPRSDRSRLLATLDQFRITNLLFSRSRGLLSRHVIRDMKRLKCGAPAHGPFTVLEVGAGGCDMAIWLARTCHARGVPAHITCIDNDPRIGRHARRRIMASGVSDRVTFQRFSAFDLDQLPDFDYIICGNTLHHFTEDQTRSLFRLMARKATRKFVASDLERSSLAWIAYWAFSTIFLHGSFARPDGLLSIARAFVRSELQALMPLDAVRPLRVVRMFPARLCVIGR